MAIERILEGRDPASRIWGFIGASDFLDVVQDVTTWALSNIESFHARPEAEHAAQHTLDGQIMRAVFPAASDRLRVRVDAVFDELGNRLSGLLCDSAIMRIAFNHPLSAVCRCPYFWNSYCAALK
jgi:hypothetical protein